MEPEVNFPAANRPLVAIVGPTGSGKSALALALAAEFSGEIVNCDSLQLYRGFDTGTAKIPFPERRNIPHHLFDVLDPQEGYSAGDYARLARSILAGISARERLPVIVGGTGFYLRALLDGLPALPGRDGALRTRLLAREKQRPGHLHRLLTRLEPSAAGRIHANDVQKVMRALEVLILTGGALPPSATAEPLGGYKILKIGLDPDRAELHRRLDARTQSMFQPAAFEPAAPTGTSLEPSLVEQSLVRQSLIEEVNRLLSEGCTGAEKPFESLGYKQVLAFMRGDMTLEDALLSTQAETRQYAKRQWTWFRRDSQVRWISGFGSEPPVIAETFRLVRTTLLDRQAGLVKGWAEHPV